jgi:hypothetical protein
MRILLPATVALLFVFAVAPPSPAIAQENEDAEITRMAKEHYKLGLEAFKAGKYPEAIKELKKAYLLKRLPPLLVNIAKTYEKLGDNENAIYYYKKYLAEAPPEAKDRADVKQAIEDLQKPKAPPPEEGAGEEQPPEAAPPEEGVRPTKKRRAPPPEAAEEAPPEEAPPATTKKKRAAPPPEEGEAQPPPVEEEAPPPPPKRKRAAPPPEEGEAQPPPVEEAAPPPPPRRRAAPPPAAPEETPRAAGTPMPTEWSHSPIDAAPPGQPIDVRVQTPVMKGVKVYLYFRAPGQADFTPVLMKRHGAEKIGRIPGEATGGKSIQYYIEAKNSAGAVVKNSGTAVDPNIVMIDPSAPPQVAGGGAAEEGGAEGEEGGAPSEGGAVAVAPTERESKREMERKLEEEAAPLSPEAQRERQKEEAARAEEAKKGPRFLGALGWSGIGLAAAGLVVAGVGAGLGFYYASYYSNLVHNDAAQNGNCYANAGVTGKNGECFFNDPTFAAGQTDLAFQTNGNTWTWVGIGTLAAGGAMIAGGMAMFAVDYVKHHPSHGSKAAPPAKKKRHRSDDESSASPVLRSLTVAPSIGLHGGGLSAGFSF